MVTIAQGPLPQILSWESQMRTGLIVTADVGALKTIVIDFDGLLYFSKVKGQTSEII